MKKLVLYSLALLTIACNSNDEKAKPADVPQSALAQSSNNEAFNTSFNTLMSSYYSLKDAFVKEDTVKVNSFATALKRAADSLKLNELKADTLIIETAKINAETISDEVKGLLGESGIDNKRKSFQMITSELYVLIRAVRYDKEVVYFTHCPMAFNNKGADWLSNSSEIVNPYLPKKMLDCGEVKDSVDFRVKK
jgi:Cu(I)/Ag(I) efflux system membrane fusion protein